MKTRQDQDRHMFGRKDAVAHVEWEENAANEMRTWMTRVDVEVSAFVLGDAKKRFPLFVLRVKSGGWSLLGNCCNDCFPLQECRHRRRNGDDSVSLRNVGGVVEYRWTEGCCGALFLLPSERFAASCCPHVCR